MSSHPTHEAKPDSHEQPGEEAVAAPSKADRMRVMLKVAVRYAVLGLPSALAIAALSVAVMAYKNNKSNVGQLSQIQAQIESLNTSLSASKAELEKLKFAAAKEKNLHNELLAKHEERVTKIIQNITPIQVKLKIRPTLEEQLSLSTSAPAAAAPVAHEPSAAAKTTPVEPVKIVPTPHAVAPKALPAAPTKPAPHTDAPKEAPHAASSNEKTVSPQVKAMKEAIEQYNKHK